MSEGVVEFFRVTIAVEKNRAVCSYLLLCVCVGVCVWVQLHTLCLWLAFGACVSVCVCEHSGLCGVCCAGHSCSKTLFPVHNDLHTGNPNGCQYILAPGLCCCVCVPVCRCTVRNVACVSACLCACPQMFSCVLTAVCLPWVFEETCLLFWPSAF